MKIKVYTFSNFIINRRTPIEIFCKKHNKAFSAYTESFIDFRKIGCEECSLENERKKKGYTNEQIIKMFKEKHGDVYDYSKVNYEKIDTILEENLWVEKK